MVFGFIRDAVSGLSRGVRGIGRMFRGHFREGLGDLGAAASVAAPFLPGGALVRAGIGGLGALLGGESGGTAVVRGLLGGRGAGNLRGDVTNILGRLFGGGGGGGGGGSGGGGPSGFDWLGEGLDEVAGRGGGGGGGILDRIGGLVRGVGGGSLGQGIARLGGLGLAGMNLYDSRQQRKSQEAFNQQRLDTLMAALGRSEEDMDARRAMGDKANAALTAALQRPGLLMSQLQ